MAAKARGTVDPDHASAGSFVEMSSRYIVDTGRCNDEAAGWDVDWGGALIPEFNHAFRTGFAAAERGDLPPAQRYLAKIDGLLPQLATAFDHVGLSADDPDRHVREIQKLQIETVHSRRRRPRRSGEALPGKSYPMHSACQVLRNPPTNFSENDC
jgi:hypothetical protein